MGKIPAVLKKYQFVKGQGKVANPKPMPAGLRNWLDKNKNKTK